jgi:uncharacterized protein
LKDRGRLWLGVEFCAFFLGLPLAFYAHPSRWNIHLAMWAVAIYAPLTLKRLPHFSWRKFWHGEDWPAAQRKIAILRFCTAIPLVILLTLYLAPERLFSFPLQHPWFWLLVMVLYPILSVLPQEVVFRCFFFRRYQTLFHKPWMLIAASALVFGFAHVVFHNFVSPSLSALGGLFFAMSFNQHRSLKWAAIEHAAYGCMVFTAGIGFYFLVGGWRP